MRPRSVKVAAETSMARSHAGFDEFARARLAELLRFGNVLAGDPHTGADLVQEALVRTCVAWPRVINQADPEGYVRRTMVRLHVSRWRHLRREQLTAAVPDAAGVPDGSGGAERGRLWQLLGELPRRQRAVLVLRYYSDFSEQQIADALGCSTGTVKSQASRGLATLRRLAEASRDREEHEPWT